MRPDRREFMRLAGAGPDGQWVGTSCSTSRPPAAAPPLLAQEVPAACRRVAPYGWRDLMLKVTGGAPDLPPPDLAAALVEPLPSIDRGVPGFEDFADEGRPGRRAGVAGAEPAVPRAGVARRGAGRRGAAAGRVPDARRVGRRAVCRAGLAYAGMGGLGV